MEIAHPGHDEFLGLHITIQNKCRIFDNDLVKCTRKFGFISATFRRNRKRDHRCRKLDFG